MAVFVFPCTGGEGSTMLGFLSHPLQLTQGRGQAQTHEELHIYVEGALEQQKFWSLPSPPPMCRTLPVSGVGDVGLLACLMFSLWLYFHECFKPPLAADLGAAWASHCPWLLASLPQLLCNHTEVHR